MHHETDAGLHEKFFRYLEEREISQRRAASAIGYSPAVIASYKAGKYGGDVAGLERRIVAWMEREAARAHVLAIPRVALPVNQNIAKCCRIAHAQRGIGLIVGESGVGKTTALQEYAGGASNVILIEVDQSYTMFKLAQAVAASVGVGLDGTLAALTERIVDRLADSDVLVIFDEADYLTTKALEWIRRVVHDKSGCGVILSGLRKLEYDLKAEKNAHDQLVTRISVLYRVPPASADDVRSVIHAVWPDMDDRHAAYVAKVGGGNLRTTINIMRGAHLIAQEQTPPEPTPSAESVRAALELVPR